MANDLLWNVIPLILFLYKMSQLVYISKSSSISSSNTSTTHLLSRRATTPRSFGNGMPRLPSTAKINISSRTATNTNTPRTTSPRNFAPSSPTGQRNNYNNGYNQATRATPTTPATPRTPRGLELAQRQASLHKMHSQRKLSSRSTDTPMTQLDSMVLVMKKSTILVSIALLTTGTYVFVMCLPQVYKTFAFRLSETGPLLFFLQVFVIYLVVVRFVSCDLQWIFLFGCDFC